MTTPDDRLARSARFWLRAYPRRWRTQRADEVVALLADLAGPAARRVDVRTAAGLVAAGWATRWRTRPPVHTYLTYRVLDLRVPARHRAWAADDIGGRLYPLRMALQLLLMALSPWLLGALPWHGGQDVPWRSWGTYAGVLVAASLIVGPSRRRAATAKHLVPRPGEQLVPGSSAYAWVARRRLRAVPGLAVLAAVLGVVLVAAVVAVVAAPRTVGVVACPPPPGAFSCAELVTATRSGATTADLGVAGAALSVGVLGAVVAGRRLRRLVPGRPTQGARRLVGPGIRGVAVVALPTGLVVAQLVAEATGRSELLVAPVAATALLALAPVVLVATCAAVRGPADLALVDVPPIVIAGRAARVDQWVTAAVPLASGDLTAGGLAPDGLAPDGLATDGLARHGLAQEGPTVGRAMVPDGATGTSGGEPAWSQGWADASDVPGRYGPFPPVDGGEGRHARWLH